MLLGAGLPYEAATALAVLLFFCTLPFTLIGNAIGRSESRKEREVEALEKMADVPYRRSVDRSTRLPPVPPKGGTGTVRSIVFKDDRVVINDNRQVNIYNGEKPKEK